VESVNEKQKVLFSTCCCCFMLLGNGRSAVMSQQCNMGVMAVFENLPLGFSVSWSLP